MRKARLAVVQAEEGVVVPVAAMRHVLALDVLEFGVLHHPERRLGVGDPAVQQLGVGGRVERAEGELAEPRRSVRACMTVRAHAVPSDAANSWKAMVFSTG